MRRPRRDAELGEGKRGTVDVDRGVDREAAVSAVNAPAAGGGLRGELTSGLAVGEGGDDGQ